MGPTNAVETHEHSDPIDVPGDVVNFLRPYQVRETKGPPLSKRRQSSEMLQLTFKNLPKSAGIEGGTL